MSDLLLKVNELNQKFNKLLRLPNLVTFDIATQSLKSQSESAAERKFFLVHTISPILVNSVIIILITTVTFFHPGNLSTGQWIILLLDAGIVLPASCGVGVLFYFYARDLVTTGNWVLQANQKYKFQLSRNRRRSLAYLVLKGR